MNDFDSLLKRSFATAEEPADEGFSVTVSRAVSHRERRRKAAAGAHTLASAVAVVLVVYCGFSVAMGLGLDNLLSAAADQVGEARGALAQAEAPSSGALVQSMTQAVGASLSQVLLLVAVLAGGLFAYRSAQD